MGGGGNGVNLSLIQVSIASAALQREPYADQAACTKCNACECLTHADKLVQAERLEELQERLHVPFDISNHSHQQQLQELWSLAFPGMAFTNLKNDLWKDMGWQVWHCQPVDHSRYQALGSYTLIRRWRACSTGCRCQGPPLLSTRLPLSLRSWHCALAVTEIGI